MREDMRRLLYAYAECAIWLTMDENEEPLDKDHDFCDLSPGTWACFERDCQSFYEQARTLIESGPEFRHSKPERAGHDFWLTRNGHGAGFWDGDWDTAANPELGSALTAIAKTFGEIALYLGDDGRIYHT